MATGGRSVNDSSARPSQRAAWRETVDVSGISGSGRPCRRTSTAAGECGTGHAIALATRASVSTAALLASPMTAVPRGPIVARCLAWNKSTVHLPTLGDGCRRGGPALPPRRSGSQSEHRHLREERARLHAEQLGGAARPGYPASAPQPFHEPWGLA